MVDMPDSALMAYVDGELAPESREAVEAVLAADPAAREGLAAFELTGREEMRLLFDPLMREPVPEQLRDLVLGFSTGLNGVEAIRPVTTKGWLAGLIGSLEGLLAPPVMSWAKMAIVLAEGEGAGWALSRMPGGGDTAGSQVGVLVGVGTAARPLTLALEGTPSGTPVSLQDGAAGEGLSFEARLTFVGRDGRYCRDYKLSDRGGSQYAGLACRRPEDGSWQIEVYARAPARSASSGSNGYVPSGQSDPIADAVAGMSEAALDTKQELDMIRSHWRAGP